MPSDPNLIELTLTAGAGGFAGGLAAGFIAYGPSRSSHRRAARCQIVRESLPALFDKVNNRRGEVEAGDAPIGQPPDIGLAFSALVRDSVAASGADYRRVVPFQATWDEIGDCYREMVGQKHQGTLTPAAQDELHRRQVGLWGRACTELGAYERWLTTMLTGSWPRRALRRVTP